jgi:outer membrane protein
MHRLGMLFVLCVGANARATTLTLDDAVSTGLRAHPSLSAADAQRDAARARIGEAYSAYLPTVGFLATGRGDIANTVAPAPTTTTNPAPPSMQTSRFNDWLSYSAQLQVQQTLYDFGRTRWSVIAAEKSAESAKADRETARATVELNVVTAYYGVLQAIALKQVADDALAQSEQHLASANALFHVGTRPEIDVASAESQRAQSRLNLVHAKNAIDLAKVTLNSTMGVEGGIDYEVVDEPQAAIAGEATGLDALVDEAVRARPEYESLRRQLAAAEAQAHVAHAGYFPTLSATGTVLARGDNQQGNQNTVDVSQQFTLNYQLFGGWITKRTVEEQEANARAARANLEVLRQSVRLGVATAVLAVGEAREAVAAAEALKAQAEKQLALATGRYQAGVGNIIELVDAQAGAVSARAQRVQAEYTLSVDRANLQRALGRPVVKSSR